MGKELVKGNKGLAARLGVHVQTVLNWRRSGVLEAATVVDYGRTIVYDLDKVGECLRHRTAKPGRPKQYSVVNGTVRESK